VLKAADTRNMSQHQRIALASLPQDVLGLIWEKLQPADRLSLYTAVPATRCKAVHTQINKLALSFAGCYAREKRRKSLERLDHFPKEASLEVCAV